MHKLSLRDALLFVVMIGAVFCLSIAVAQATPSGFTTGDLVVEVDQQSATGNLVDPVVLVDYSTAGVASGYSVALPTTASGNNNPLVDFGGYENGGLITDSADGGNVVLAGYASAAAAASDHASPDVIGIVGSTGTVDTTTEIADGASGVEETHYARSATLDASGQSATELFVSGSQAVDELAPDTIATTDNFLGSSGTDNAYDLQIVNGDLYESASASQACANGSIDEVTGLPPGGPQTQAALICSPTSGTGNASDTTHFSPEQFILLTNAGASGNVNVIYVADSYSKAPTAASTTEGAVEKYTCTSGCSSSSGWSYQGGVTLAYPTGLTAEVTSSGVDIFATGGDNGGSSGSTLDEIVDASCGSAVGDTACASTTLVGDTVTRVATATGDNVFHGVAWAPTNSAVPASYTVQTPMTLTSTTGTEGVPLTLSSSGGSGSGAVTYAVTNAGTANCSLTGGGTTLTATTTGTCSVTVTKASSGSYLSASSPQTTVSFLLSPAPISVSSLSGTANVPLALAYSGGSGTGIITYAVTSAGATNCVISGDAVVTAAAAGTCTVTVSQASDGTYSANSSAPAGIIFTQGSAGTPAGGNSTYSAATPVLDSIVNGTSAAPWNEYQGDSSTALYTSQSPGTVLPTYTPGGATNTTDSITRPNLAVYPGTGSGSDGTSGFSAPYPAGTVGTPGPDDGYCGAGDNTAETSLIGAPVRQPIGTTLPLAPAYFPHIVANADGSLTGYFDWRPKDTDEAIVVARSTNGGLSWTYEGEALESDPGYCPNSDMNDDGEGHPNVVKVGSTSYLYTLPRAAGDQLGTGMLVHQLNPTASNPLNGVPSTEKVGIDPDDFAASAVDVPNSSGTPATITFTTQIGTGLEQLVPGEFVDLTQNPTPSASNVIYCTTVNAQSLSGCLSAASGGLNIEPGDLIEQVLGVVEADGGGAAATSGAAATVGCGSLSTTPTTSGAGDLPCTVPQGPNTPVGDGGLTSFTLMASPDAPSGPATSFTASVGANNDLWMATLNLNAPNRLYIDGTAVYCSQSNSLPTTKIEDCTTGPNGSSTLTVNAGDPVITDPIVPATAQQTTGLIAPDGIVGVLPSYPGAPAGSTIVMYTEKILNYFIVGSLETPASQVTNTVNSADDGDFEPNMTITMDPFFNTGSEPLSSGANTIYIGDNNTNAIAVVRCSAYNSSTDELTGCNVTGSIGGTVSLGDAIPSKAYVGGPGAATALASTLAQIGEGSATDPQKLLKNNEDLSLLRVAYTTDGVDFTASGLANGGIISGADNGDVTAAGATGTVNCAADSGVAAYTDISDPCTIASPPNLNAYANHDAANGTSTGAGTDTGSTGDDAIEMRWVGTGGSIITNPDGSYGLFLSGAWENDGDSDAFNQVYYSSSKNGETWSVPTPVISTDYSFAASVTQENQIDETTPVDAPLGISAYYSGRAYDPTVVQNANGTLTMVFAGDRLPKSISTVGTSVGTNNSAQYTIGPNDPTLYRNILTTTLTAASSPAVATTTALGTSSSPILVGASVTYTATVTNTGPGTPTGTVTFNDGGTPISGCTAVALSDTATDTASCTTTPSGASAHSISAVYSGDSNYATSTGTTSEQVTADATTTALSASATSVLSGASVTYTATVAVTSPGTVAPTGTVAFTDNGVAISGCGAVTLSTTSPHIATCTTTASAVASHTIAAAFGGSSSDATSSGSASVQVTPDLTTTAVTLSPATPVLGSPVTYTATVSVTSPGTVAPTGTVAFTDAGTAISGCGSVALSTTSPYTASCTTTPTSGSHSIVASYGGSSTDAASASGSTSITLSPGTINVVAVDQSRAYGQANPTLTAEVGGDPVGTLPSGVSGAPACTTTATTSSTAGAYAITCTTGTLSASNDTFTFTPGILTVTGSAPTSTTTTSTSTSTTTITGTHTGTITVAAGKTVKIEAGAKIDGAVKVAAGGSLEVSGGTFKHALTLSGAATVKICNATFDAGVSVKDAKDAVTVGGSSCAGDKVTGSLSVTGAHGSVHVEHNTVSSSLMVHANLDGATVTGNTVHGSLEVTANKGTVTDRPNTVHGASHLQ